MAAPVPISLIILAHNEERNIEACLASAIGFEDRHVLDSGSTDLTAALAEKAGAKAWYNAFAGFGTQRNWAIEHIPTRYPWQLQLDADERLTPELIAEAIRAVSHEPRVGGYRLANKIYLGKKWIKRATGYPTYQVRLFHKERLRFVDHGHGQREVTTWPLGTLQEPYLHYAFSHGLDAWLHKHVGYARREAEQFLAAAGQGGGSIFTSDPVQRRRALKSLTYRLPFRHFFRFIYLALIKGAVLDGKEGITYAHMVATYEGMVEVYLRALKHGLFT